jgi:hypothetical protein
MNINLIKRIWFKDPFDGVIDGVRYTSNGKIEWVRAYERRGPTWSDHVIIDREILLERLKNGKKFFVGKRILQHASEFELDQKVELRNGNGDKIIVTEKTIQKTIDHLDGAGLL